MNWTLDELNATPDEVITVLLEEMQQAHETTD